MGQKDMHGNIARTDASYCELRVAHQPGAEYRMAAVVVVDAGLTGCNRAHATDNAVTWASSIAGICRMFLKWNSNQWESLWTEPRTDVKRADAFCEKQQLNAC